MTCKNCLMFTHCRYDLERNGEPCENFKDKSVLEKQIPKKPIKQIWVDDEKRKDDVRLATKDDVLTKDNHSIINLCPNCKEWVMRYKYLRPPKDKDYYCKCCGQALDWSDTE